MTNLQKGLQREIALFVEAIESEGRGIPEISKAAFCKARKKLKPTAFGELSKVTCQTFYGSNEVQLMEWLKEVYGFRWPIEESYKTFIHKVCIVNFPGESYKAVLQDFYVQQLKKLFNGR